MSMYRYNDTDYTLQELRTVFPRISLPATPTAESLRELGVTIVPDKAVDQAEILADARARKLRELSERFAHAEKYAHFASSLGFEVDANERANRDVQGLVTMLEATGQTETMYCDYGNVMHRVTLEQLGTLQLEIILHGQMIYAHKWQLRSAIEAASTLEELAAIEIGFDALPAPDSITPTEGEDA